MVKPVNLLQIASIIGKYQKGLYAQYPDLISHFRTSAIRVQCTEASVVNVDGESLVGQDVTFSVMPKALRFFYPAGLQYRSKARNPELSGAF